MSNNPIERLLSSIVDVYHKISFEIDSKIVRDKNASRDQVLLLGQGWFAKGFMEHIDRSKFAVKNIARHPFINTPMILSTVQETGERDNEVSAVSNIARFRRYFEEEILDETIEKIDLEGEQVVTDKGTHSFKDHFLVCGVGSQVDNALYWKKNIHTLRSLSEQKENSGLNKKPSVCIIGAGLSGTELAFYLADMNHSITLYDGLALPRLYEYLSRDGKTHVLQRLANKQIALQPGQLFDNKDREKFDLVVFATGSRPNALTSQWKLSPRFQLENYPRVFAGGDGVSSSFPRTAQVAYEQGKYVAKVLNKEVDEDFSFHSKGLSMYCGDKEYYTEVNIGPQDERTIVYDANPGRLPNLLVRSSSKQVPGTEEQRNQVSAQLLLNVPSDVMSVYYNIFK